MPNWRKEESMKKAIVVLFGVAVLAGCGSKQDVNEKNFGVAIGQYLDKKGELCLRLTSGLLMCQKWT